MGIARNDIFCPGCRSKIRLRLGVGTEKNQPFYFVCSNCNASAHGEVQFDDAWIGTLLLEGSPAELTYHDKADQVITIHPDMPSLINAGELWDEGGSPFFLQQQMIGDDRAIPRLDGATPSFSWGER